MDVCFFHQNMISGPGWVEVSYVEQMAKYTQMHLSLIHI
jgi:hypothetical protein